MNILYPTSKLDMFNRFLGDFDLIGMKQDDVFRLLGEGYSIPDGYKGNFRNVTYNLEATRNPFEGFGLKINFENGKVKSWFFFSREKKSPEITENVRLLRPRNVAKRGIQFNPVDTIWPEVTPKKNNKMSF